MHLPLRNFLWLACVLLAACGRNGPGDQATALAATAQVSVITQVAGATPFISRLTMGLQRFDAVATVSYTIAPKPGTYSKPVSVTYDKSWLERNRAYDSASHQLALPLFGLYANYRNDVRVTVAFNDRSSHEQRIPIQTAAYSADAALYDNPTIRSPRAGPASPGFDFIMIKNGLTTPVVIDTDGNLRWIATGLTDSVSSIFVGDRFLVGSRKTLELYHLGMDGSLATTKLSSATLTNFHHDLAPGKTGLLAEMDAAENGVTKIESILAEITPSGRVIRQWDMASIFRDFMRAHGDDPSNFVRDGIDWFHLNSAVYNRADDSLLVSSRENFVVKLDYETGQIRWLLGDPAKHWYLDYPSLRSVALAVTNGNPPIGQHALSVTPDGNLLLFNNGTPSLEAPAGTPAGTTIPFSAPVKYAIDEQARTASVVWSDERGRTLLSEYCSSAYQIGADHYLVTYSFADDQTKARLIGLDTAGNTTFDFEYPGKLCGTMFLATPIGFDALHLK
jgi:arylsulfate sulfotransferase